MASKKEVTSFFGQVFDEMASPPAGEQTGEGVVGKTEHETSNNKSELSKVKRDMSMQVGEILVR